MIRKYLILLFISILTWGALKANQVDSLLSVLDKQAEDSLKVKTLLALAAAHYGTDKSKAVEYGTQAKDLSQQIAYLRGEAYAFKSIGMAYYYQGMYVDASIYWQSALEVFEKMDNSLGICNMQSNLGAIYFNEGDNNKAIEYYLKSLKISEEINDTLRIATALINIGAVYYSKEATQHLAQEYYLRALPLSESLGDFDAIGTSAVNLGQFYLGNENDSAALFYFEKSLDAYRKSETGNVPYALLNIGRVYAFRKDYVTALSYQNEAYYIASENNSRLEIAQTLLGLAGTYMEMGEIDEAISRYRRATELAEEIGSEYVQFDAYIGLSQAYAEVSDYQNAYDYHLKYNVLKDTLYNAEMDKKIEAMTLLSEIDKQKGEINLLTKDQELKELTIKRQKLLRNAIAITGVLILFLALGMLSRYRYVRRTKKIIEDEKDRSDKLLLNILPEETAEELKEKGTATPKYYDMVTVLFTDFKGFTRIAEQLSPRELVAELDFCFHAFDKIIDKHNIEKIKTIGDAYMCAGGIPVANTSNPVDVVKAGLEISEFMEKLKRQKNARGEDSWELRIGIHTGPVIAGVVGKNKFAYDIWGDAVNLASRMESSGIPGKVNISGSTYKLVKEEFSCVHRGMIEAKNKGEVDMYIVDGFKKEGDEKKRPHQKAGALLNY